MKETLKTTVALALVFCLPLSHAHRAWILPDATVLSSEEPWVTFDAAISNDIFFTDYHPMRLDDLQIQGPDGKAKKAENLHTGKFRSSFDLKLETRGTYRIFMASHGLRARWEYADGKQQGWPGRGEAYTEEGFKKNVPAKADKLEVTQFSRRIETFVTAGEPDRAVLAATNSGLELVPTTHPNDLFAGEEAQFQFLIDGQPAAGASVELVPDGVRYRNEQALINPTADADGKVKVTWPRAGRYFMEVEYNDDKANKPATLRSGSYSAVLEVLPE